MANDKKLLKWANTPSGIENYEHRTGYEHAQFDVRNLITNSEFETESGEDVQEAIEELKKCRDKNNANWDSHDMDDIWVVSDETTELAIQALEQMQDHSGTCNTCGGQTMTGFVFCPYCGEFPDGEQKQNKEPCDFCEEFIRQNAKLLKLQSYGYDPEKRLPNSFCKDCGRDLRKGVE